MHSHGCDMSLLAETVTELKLLRRLSGIVTVGKLSKCESLDCCFTCCVHIRMTGDIRLRSPRAGTARFGACVPAAAQHVPWGISLQTYHDIYLVIHMYGGYTSRLQ